MTVERFLELLEVLALPKHRIVHPKSTRFDKSHY